MLGNFNPKSIQELKNLRAETNESSLFNFARIHLEKTSFETAEDLVSFLNKIPDDECERFISSLIKTKVKKKS